MLNGLTNSIPAPSLRILLVEDDISVGSILKDILSKNGYDVVLTEDLADTARLTDFRFAAVVSDYRLKRSIGCDVIQLARSKNPKICALLMSGYGQRVANSCADRGIPNVFFLEKPFTAPQFLQALAVALNADTSVSLQ